MFVTLRELAPFPVLDPVSTASGGEKATPPYTRILSKGECDAPSRQAQSKLDSKAVNDGSKDCVNHDRAQLGQRVIFCDKYGKKHFGVVQWIGKESQTRKFKYNVLGIKSVSLFLCDFLYCSASTSLFSTLSAHAQRVNCQSLCVLHLYLDCACTLSVNYVS